MLNRIFSEKKEVLLQAAKAVCRDPMFVYDTIYLAVIKTKQKYKKLANKERAVEVCISLMKQPKNHVKQSFESVEDCIEKALAAKIVPWRPILSAVAVVLAAALLVPLCLTGNSQPAEVGGFEMENTLSIANSYSDNGTYLKNFHKISAFGGPDLAKLTEIDLTEKWTGQYYHNMITTSNDITYMAVAYVNKSNKSAEFILYRAEVSGWVRVGSAPIGVFTNTYSLGETMKHTYSISQIHLVCDKENNVYVLSSYGEGVQIHICTSEGEFHALGTQKLADLRPFAPSPVTTRNGWIQSSHVVFDEETQTIAFLCDSLVPFLKSNGNSTENPELCIVTFDLSKREFSAPLYFANNCKYSTMGLLPDRTGGFYILLQDEIETTFQFGSFRPKNIGVFLYHLKDGALSRELLVTDDSETVSAVRMFEIDEDGAIHLVYVAEMNRKIHYVKIVDNEILTTYNIVSTSEDDTKVDNFIRFYRINGELYYVELILNEYLFFTQTNGKVTKRIAEIHLPEKYSLYPYALLLSGYTTSSSQGFILNVVFSSSVQETYFGQILCDCEPTKFS